MKTIIKNYFFLLTLLLTVNCFSQKNETFTILSNAKIKTIDLRSKALVGSSYIKEEFLPVKISGSEKIYSMRYNAYRDEMEIDKDRVPYYIPKRLNFTVTFLGTDKVYQVYSHQKKEGNKPGFFVVLSKGIKIDLLLKEKIQLREEVEAKSGYDKYQPPTLKRVKDKLYIGYRNSTTAMLPKKKKDILKLFSSAAKDIVNYADENRLSFKKHQDLVQIFNYYNSLE